MKHQLTQLLLAALQKLGGAAPPDAAMIVIERTRDSAHGDYATNVAMRLAKSLGRNPRELAQAIVMALPANPLIARAEVAGGGFINFFLQLDAYTQELVRLHEQGADFGRSDVGRGRRVLLEFVSANPTGPLHVGHGRLAAYGATVAKLLTATGWRVHREFYINDAGRQVDILALSVWLRYLELCGEPVTFPSNGYRGDYLRPVAAALRAKHGESLRRPAPPLFAGLPPDAPVGDKEQHVDALIARMRELLGVSSFDQVLDSALAELLADVRADLAEFGVEFDQWYSERQLIASGAIDRALERLIRNGHIYEKDGAQWFRATAFGDDEDRVVVRANGVRTYFASDIAYHLDKRLRGYERLIDVLGADHHGYQARVRGGLVAMGEPGDCLEVCLIQLVSLYRGGEKIPMGKREGNFVTLRQLRGEVGNDAARFFYVMRNHEQALDFDLELAKSRRDENPVWYVQYGHARICQVMKEVGARGYRYDRDAGLANRSLLSTEHERQVLAALASFPEVLEQAAENRAPHTLVTYMRELVAAFHSYYNAERFIVADDALRNARLALIDGVRQVLRNGAALLGISAPETM